MKYTEITKTSNNKMKKIEIFKIRFATKIKNNKIFYKIKNSLKNNFLVVKVVPMK